MSMLRIKRDSGYADYLRAYSVMLNGTKVGEIRNGETREIPIPPGQYELRLKIDWCGSNTIRFAAFDSDTLNFSVQSNLRGVKLLAALWYVLFQPNAWITLQRES